jgi:hypothetical protein
MYVYINLYGYVYGYRYDHLNMLTYYIYHIGSCELGPRDQALRDHRDIPGQVRLLTTYADIALVCVCVCLYVYIFVHNAVVVCMHTHTYIDKDIDICKDRSMLPIEPMSYIDCGVGRFITEAMDKQAAAERDRRKKVGSYVCIYACMYICMYVYIYLQTMHIYAHI